MRFKNAVANAHDVRDWCRVGLRALLERDRNKLSCDDPRKITGSLYLDSALSCLYPNQQRWDYGIGLKKKRATDEAIWLEVHSAKADQVRVMIEKLRWLKNWLHRRAPDLLSITTGNSPYIWIASGRVAFQRNSPQLKRLALAGLTFPREHYHIQT